MSVLRGQCAGMPELSNGIVHIFVGGSFLHYLVYIYMFLTSWLLAKFVFVRQILMCVCKKPFVNGTKEWLAILA